MKELEGETQASTSISRREPYSYRSVKHKRPLELTRKLEKRSAEVQPKLTRISPHFYNTKDDVERLVETLKGLKVKSVESLKPPSFTPLSLIIEMPLM